MSLLLEVHQLGKKFGKKAAIKNLSFSLTRNEILGIIGPNGAGKTTLLNLISGFYSSDQGEILFSGKKLPSRLSLVSQEGIARTFQHIRLFKDLSVIENIRIASLTKEPLSIKDALFFPQKKKKILKKIDPFLYDLCSLLGLTPYLDFKPTQLSYGIQRRVEIARAVALKPLLLLLDEPVAGMNEEEREEMISILKVIQKEYTLAMMIIEHDLYFLSQLASRLLVLNFGELLICSDPITVKNHPKVIEAYLGKE